MTVVKELWVWAGTSIFSDAALGELRAEFPSVSIRRVVGVSGFWWRSTLNDSPYFTPYISGEGTTFTSEFLTDFLVPNIDWDPTHDPPVVDHGVIEASQLGNLGGGFDGYSMVMDLEPGADFFVKTDPTYSDAVKQNYLEGYAEIRELIRAIRPDYYDVNQYSTILFTSGRDTNHNGGAAKMVAWAYDQGLTGLDDTALFGERSFYPSGRDWSDIFDDWDTNLAFSVQHSDLGPVKDLTAILYADNRMLDPDDPRLAGTGSEGITGGIELFKAWARALATKKTELGLDDKGLLAVTRRYTTPNTLQADDPGELAHDPVWFQQMAEFLAMHPSYTVLCHFAGGAGSEDGDLGNGTTLRDQLKTLAREIELANASFAQIADFTNASTSHGSRELRLEFSFPVTGATVNNFVVKQGELTLSSLNFSINGDGTDTLVLRRNSGGTFSRSFAYTVELTNDSQNLIAAPTGRPVEPLTLSVQMIEGNVPSRYILLGPEEVEV